MRVAAIIAAGGVGRRLGTDTPKQFLDIGGVTLLQRSVTAFYEHPDVSEIVVVTPEGRRPPRKHFSSVNRSTQPLLTFVDGGATRQQSVANGFARVSPDVDVVLVHDAARPFVSASVISRTIQAAAHHGAAIAAVPAHDTVKRVEHSPAGTIILETIARDTVFLAQTPQGFRRDVLEAAVAIGRSGIEATDEAALAERAGFKVHVVQGDAANVKITTEEDLAAARRQAAAHAADRVGTGYDLHRLVDGRPLVLGGVTIPSTRGALGHSDADVICHAATDAVLGAAGLGDIGRHFPDTDPRWKDASSIGLLRSAAEMARARGFEVMNLDVTVLLEAPKIKDYVDAMRNGVAGALGIEPARVSIKGKTNEGVDAVGRGEAIAAHAVALLRTVEPRASSFEPRS